MVGHAGSTTGIIYADVTLTRSKVKVKVTEHLNFRQLPRVRGKTIRSVLCNIVCNNCAQCDAHTYEQTNSSLDWVLSHWAHFTVLDSFLYCVLLCVVCMIA